MVMHFRMLVISGILMVLLLLSSGCMQVPATPTQAPPAGGTVINSTSLGVPTSVMETAKREQMVSFVHEAVAYANQNGKEEDLTEFSNPKGSFFRGVLYICANDFNGTTIAHPLNPEKIGVNRLNKKDAEGNRFIIDLRQATYNGTGFATTTYIYPVHNNTVEKKLGYVMKVDDLRARHDNGADTVKSHFTIN